MELRRRNLRELYRCLMGLAESRGIIVETVDGITDYGMRGLYYYDGKLKSPVILLAKGMKLPERIWTLAHELGHYLTDRILGIEFGYTLKLSEENAEWAATPKGAKWRLRQAEALADEFARCLIMAYGGRQDLFPKKKAS